ncbi:HD-GYP domain-containing protein [Desulfitobacterium sp. AusDCA]|uniref:HD-GYP domain-containing protein n=1 Tax=Desulfitobacterium sp. AusDCA TaxID=3240383 RepID=UPI003DA74B8D
MATKVLQLNHVREGMKVAKSIYGPHGEILLAAGVSLNSFYIKRLEEMEVAAIYIEDEATEGIVINDVISEKTRIEAIKLTKECMNNIKLQSSVDVAKVNQVITDIVDELLSNNNIIVQVLEIRALNDHTFSHSVNVAVLSVITGIALGFDYKKLKDLALGALFHDIGKTLMPESILFKTEPLTQKEEEIWKKHPLLGFDILRKLPTINLTNAHIALEHHERYDGKGFPRGLSGNVISELARVVTVCNQYDKMTTYQIGQPRMKPFQAIEVLIGNSSKFFDADIVRAFLGIIAIFPIGSKVTLNIGVKGIVIEAYKNYPTRPKVRVLTDKNGEKIFPPYDIDLTDMPEICIIKVEEEG